MNLKKKTLEMYLNIEKKKNFKKIEKNMIKAKLNKNGK